MAHAPRQPVRVRIEFKRLARSPIQPDHVQNERLEEVFAGAQQYGSLYQMCRFSTGRVPRETSDQTTKRKHLVRE